MITIKNVKTISGAVITHTLDSPVSKVIDGEQQLLMLPSFTDVDAVIKKNSLIEDLSLYSESGITTLLNATPCLEKELSEEKASAEKLIQENHLPLQVYWSYNGNHPEEYEVLGKNKSAVVAVKVSLNLAKKPIEPPHISALDRLFQLAAQENLVVIVTLMQGSGNFAEQRETALAYVEEAISLTEKYNTELCLQHVRTKEELKLIKEAKKRGLLIYVEVAYPHLFFKEGNCSSPSQLFLPNEEDHKALWKEVKEGTVDMIGSSGFYSLQQLFIPMMLEATNQKLLSLERLVELTRINPEAIFRLSTCHDVVLIDRHAYLEVSDSLVNLDPLFWKGKVFSSKVVCVATPQGIITPSGA